MKYTLPGKRGFVTREVFLTFFSSSVLLTTCRDIVFAYGPCAQCLAASPAEFSWRSILHFPQNYRNFWNGKNLNYGFQRKGEAHNHRAYLRLIHFHTGIVVSPICTCCHFLQSNLFRESAATWWGQCCWILPTSTTPPWRCCPLYSSWGAWQGLLDHSCVQYCLDIFI